MSQNTIELSLIRNPASEASILCASTAQVNVLASIFLGSRSDAIRVFLEEPYQFSLGSLSAMFCVFFPLTIAAFGQDLSGGVFLPR